ncbi:MAG: ATP-dependent Clp protease adaptor ClpS [Saprospiraceae bacterium]|nr:ATP-dependent Clp protease adaptor ClpS [Saprospiraceae bacterium]
MNPFYSSIDIDVEEDIDIDLESELSDIGTGDAAYLIVFNDDVNTFDWVIQSFMEVLDYPADQSEQLAMMIHLKGKATVKTAPLSVLRPKREALCERKLSAVIEGGSDESDK